MDADVKNLHKSFEINQHVWVCLDTGDIKQFIVKEIYTHATDGTLVYSLERVDNEKYKNTCHLHADYIYPSFKKAQKSKEKGREEFLMSDYVLRNAIREETWRQYSGSSREINRRKAQGRLDQSLKFIQENLRTVFPDYPNEERVKILEFILHSDGMQVLTEIVDCFDRNLSWEHNEIFQTLKERE